MWVYFSAISFISVLLRLPIVRAVRWWWATAAFLPRRCPPLRTATAPWPARPLWVQLPSDDYYMEKDRKAWAPHLKAGQLGRCIIYALNLPARDLFNSSLYLSYFFPSPTNYWHSNLHLRACFLENPTNTPRGEENQWWWQWERTGSRSFSNSFGSQQLGHCKQLRNYWSAILLTLQYFIPTTQPAPHMPGNFSYSPFNNTYFQSLHLSGSLNHW